MYCSCIALVRTALVLLPDAQCGMAATGSNVSPLQHGICTVVLRQKLPWYFFGSAVPCYIFYKGMLLPPKYHGIQWEYQCRDIFGQ